MLIRFLKSFSSLSYRLFLLLVFVLSPFVAFSAGEKIDYPKQQWSFSGITGTFDRASQQRGLQV